MVTIDQPVSGGCSVPPAWQRDDEETPEAGYVLEGDSPVDLYACCLTLLDSPLQVWDIACR